MNNKSPTVGLAVLTAFALAVELNACGGPITSASVPAASISSLDSGRTTGRVTTIAGSGRAQSVDGMGRNASFNSPSDITIDRASGLMYVLQPYTQSIRILSLNGKVGTLTGRLKVPTALAFDGYDSILYAGSASTGDVSRITLSGAVSKFVHIPQFHELPPDVISKIAFDASGIMHLTESRNGAYVNVSPQGKIEHYLVSPGIFGICLGHDGIYTVNQLFGTLQRISNSAQGSFATSKLLRFTATITYDTDNGAFYVVDPGHNRILKATADKVTVLAGNGQAGEIDGPLKSAEFNNPEGIVYDHQARALFVTDAGGNTVRELQGI